MAERTNIAWTDHSWSPWWGCTKVSVGDKGACVNCYAEALDKRVGGDHWGHGKPRRELSEHHWRAPRRWNHMAAEAGEQRTVFPSMCDPFDKEVGNVLRGRFFSLIRETPHLTWLLLTKRPQNIVRLSLEAGGLPPNAMLGATVVTQKEVDRDIPHLIRAAQGLSPSGVFLSCEPLMEHIDLEAWLRCGSCGYSSADARLHGDHALCGAPTPIIDWVIVGGESGPHPRPMHPDWARSLRDQCAEAGVAFFFKQHGGRTPMANGCLLDGSEWKERPYVAPPRDLLGGAA